MARPVGQDQRTLFEARGLLIEAQHPRHVFHGEPVRAGGDEMRQDLRHHVADDRQVERLRHSGDLHPRGDATDTSEVMNDGECITLIGDVFGRARIDHEIKC